MQVLKVVVEGLTASFRYPHFMQGVQPSFEVPPPATLYGFICSVLGKWFDPTGVQFAIHFTFKSRFTDIEHTHVLKPATGKLPGTKIPKVIEGAVNPFNREILFKPRLVLYINRPEWLNAFIEPAYAISLGRSQDLVTISELDVIELEEGSEAYLEHTLAPYQFASKTGKGIAILMPRFLDYGHQRYPMFSRYIILNRRVFTRDLLKYDDRVEKFWIDPYSPEIEGKKLGLIFHTWVNDDGTIEQMA